MPSLNLSKNTVTYFASDENVLKRAVDLLSQIAAHDTEAAQDATTALNSTKHVLAHVTAKRSKPEQPTTTDKKPAA